MKIMLSPSLIKLANRVAKIPGLKKLLKPFYYSYKSKLAKNRNEQFKCYGMTVLELFDRVMVENNIPYTVFAGTMLGAIREHTFISHDMDIDTAIFYNDRPNNLTELLCAYGFKLIHKFDINDGKRGLEETYIKDNVTLDIFYIYNDSQSGTYQCDFHPEIGSVSCDDSMKKYGYVIARRLEFPVSHNFLRIPFANIHVNVVDNYDEWLSCRYGKDYMVPNPQFSDNGTNPFIIEEWLQATYHSFDL